MITLGNKPVVRIASRKFSSRMKFQANDEVMIQTGGNLQYLDGKTGIIKAIDKHRNIGHAVQGTRYFVYVTELRRSQWIASGYMERLDNPKGLKRLRKFDKMRESIISNRRTNSRLAYQRKKVGSTNAVLYAEIRKIEKELSELVGPINSKIAALQKKLASISAPYTENIQKLQFEIKR